MKRNPSKMNNGKVLNRLDTTRYIEMMRKCGSTLLSTKRNPTVLFKTGNAQWLDDRNMEILDAYIDGKIAELKSAYPLLISEAYNVYSCM
jgi:hypothetical protein